MPVRINLVRTKQPVKPVLPVRDTIVCVLLDLKENTARAVGCLKSLSSPT